MPARFYESPPWRFVVAKFNGAVDTYLDHLASNKAINLVLNAPASAAMDVPSDNPEINITEAGVPFVSMSDKLLMGFRRDGPSNKPWRPRFGGILLQPNDEITAGTDVPTTHITAFDPWMYLNHLPVLAEGGILPGQQGVVYDGKTGDFIVIDLLVNALASMAGGSFGAPFAASNMFMNWNQSPYTPFYTGTMETTDVIPSITFAQGMMVGEAWTMLTQGGYLDLWLEPIWDPENQPGLVCQLNIYNLKGTQQPGALFSWDMVGRTNNGQNRMQDGTALINNGQGYAGQGGSAVVPRIQDGDSIALYGDWWNQQFYTNLESSDEVVSVLEAAQVGLRRTGKQTITLDPAPERAPSPFTEYNLGDQVPVYWSSNFRLALKPTLEDVGSTNHWLDFQRVYGIPITLPDDGVETVTGVVLNSPYDVAGT